MAETSKPTHPLASVGGIAGAAGGWVLSHYAGASLWIPGAATVLLFLLFNKTPLRPKFFLGAIATTGGHVLWFITASFLAQIWATTAPDIVILSIAILWLWLRPSLAAALFLGVVQLGSLAYNGYLLSSQPVGSLPLKALTVHCIWHAIAVLCLVTGYLQLRRERKAAGSPPPLPVPVQPQQTNA
jgi:hypothetical protein